MLVKRAAIQFSTYENSNSIYEDDNDGKPKDDALKLAVRLFAFSSYRIFKKLAEEAVDHSSIFTSSQQLREKLVILYLDLAAIYTQLGDDPSNTSDLQKQVYMDGIEKAYQMIRDMENSWHICEIFHLNPTKALSLEMCKWLDDCGENLNFDENYKILKSMKPKPETNERYWSLFYQLCLRGHLDEAISLFQIHSIVCSIGSSKKKDTSDEKAMINTFFEILRAYPRFNSDQQLDLRKVSTDFQNWYERVRKFQLTSAKLISHIPELCTALKILLGDMETLKEYCNEKWTNLTLALLLYVYPPPLTKIDLSKIVEEAMNEIGVQHHDEMEKRQRATMKDIMVGNLASALRLSYEMKSSCTDNCAFLSVACLLNTAHLTFILAHGAHMHDLLEVKVDSSSDSSFYDELFLELGDSLNFLEYPIDVIVFYFHNCKSKGMEYLRHLLPRRQITSDEDALAISSTLRSLDLIEDARVVEVARGTWWLQFNSNIDSNGAIKALYFYQLARDNTRSRAILDRAMWTCIIAVYACSTLFNELSFMPSKPQEGSFQYTSYDSQIYFEGDNIGKENRLFNALAKADELIGTIIEEDDEVGILAENLSGYIQAVRLRLLILVLQDSREILLKLKMGGSIIFKLLEDAFSNGRGISVRYWLHLVDLCAWFDDEHKRRCEDLNTGDGVECTIFSKREVHVMSQAMEVVLKSCVQDMIHSDKIKTENLRKKLLGLLTASIVQSNSIKGNDKFHLLLSKSSTSNYDILTSNSFNRYI